MVRAPGRFEVMEIGAGTGGTAARVLDRLPAENLGYLYTDIGPTFVAKARARFGHDQRMDFATFALERDLAGQGLRGRTLRPDRQPPMWFMRRPTCAPRSRAFAAC